MAVNKNKSFDVEVGFISKYLETKDNILVKDMQIKKSYFSGENKNAFDFITNHLLKTGEIPSVRVFKRKFPHYPLESYKNSDGETLIGTEESLQFWCQELRIKKKHNTLVDTIEDLGDLLQDLKTDEAYNFLRKQISYIENEVVESTDIDITKNTLDRKKAYIKKKNSGGMIGLSTGFTKLDFLTKGLKDETLTTIIAKTGVGKTFLLILLACNLILNGNKVILGITEMSEELMLDRFEALLFALTTNHKFSYNDFKSGNLSPKLEKDFFTFLEETLPDLGSLIIFTASSPLGVSAEIEKHNPDVVMIDGAYLMEDDEQAKDDWLRVTHITRDLKKLAKRTKKPIVINTQANKNTSKKVGPDIGDIMYTQSVGQDSDDIFALYQDEVMRNDHEMMLAIRKQREGGLGKILFNWDFDNMQFGEIYAEKDSDLDNENDNIYVED